MSAELRLFHKIAIGLALLMLMSCVAMASGEENNKKAELNSSIGNTTPSILPADDAEAAVSVKSPAIPAKALAPSVQRKISTNLLYILDSDIPEKGMSRGQAADAMKASGQIKTVVLESAAGQWAGKSETAQLVTNQIFVYVDIDPSASTSVVDSYFQNMTSRNEQEHYVAGWVDVNSVDPIASLDAVSNIRPGEPSITKASPVYHDTKYVNKREGQPPLTAEGAKASVREFENAPGMVLEQKRTMSTPRGTVYEMASDSGRYFVNAKTGDVELVFYYSRSSTKTGQITFDQAYLITQKYVEKNYDSFSNRTMVLTESSLIDHGASGKIYYFTWMEKINEVFVPNVVSVSIDSANGDILSYIRQDQPLNINLKPTVSKETAIIKATTALSPLSGSIKSDTRLFVQSVNEKNQRLVWIVSVFGHTNSDFPQGGDAIIDAQSGEVVLLNPYK